MFDEAANHNDQPRAGETGNQRWGWHVRQLCKRRALLRQDDGRAGSDRSSGCRQRREASLKAVGGCTEREQRQAQSRDAHVGSRNRKGEAVAADVGAAHERSTNRSNSRGGYDRYFFICPAGRDPSFMPHILPRLTL